MCELSLRHTRGDEGIMHSYIYRDVFQLLSHLNSHLDLTQTPQSYPLLTAQMISKLSHCEIVSA